MEEGIRSGAGEETALRCGLIRAEQDDMGTKILRHLLQKLRAGGPSYENGDVLIQLRFVDARGNQYVADGFLADGALLFKPLLVGAVEFAQGGDGQRLRNG